jgi:hypothetical protein
MTTERYLAKPLAFPDATKFSELFVAHSFDKNGLDGPGIGNKYQGDSWTIDDYNMVTGRTRKETIKIGPYCHGRGPSGEFFSLYVRPTDEVVAYIKAHMLGLARDTIGFEIVVRRSETDDYEALVIAHNNLIIGNRWLALIDATTLPIPPVDSEVSDAR